MCVIVKMHLFSTPRKCSLIIMSQVQFAVFYDSIVGY